MIYLEDNVHEALEKIAAKIDLDQLRSSGKRAIIGRKGPIEVVTKGSPKARPKYGERGEITESLWRPTNDPIGWSQMMAQRDLRRAPGPQRAARDRDLRLNYLKAQAAKRRW